MRWLRQLANRCAILTELVRFLWTERLWWLIPMVAILVVFAALFLLAQSAPIAPFVYTLF